MSASKDFGCAFVDQTTYFLILKEISRNLAALCAFMPGNSLLAVVKCRGKSLWWVIKLIRSHPHEAGIMPTVWKEISVHGALPPIKIGDPTNFHRPENSHRPELRCSMHTLAERLHEGDLKRANDRLIWGSPTHLRTRFYDIKCDT